MAKVANTKGSNNIGAVARIAWVQTQVHGPGTGWGKNQHGNGNGGQHYTIVLLPLPGRQFAASAQPVLASGKLGKRASLVSAGTFAQAYNACATHNKKAHAAKLAAAAKRAAKAAAPAAPAASA